MLPIIPSPKFLHAEPFTGQALSVFPSTGWTKILPQDQIRRDVEIRRRETSLIRYAQLAGPIGQLGISPLFLPARFIHVEPGKSDDPNRDESTRFTLQDVYLAPEQKTTGVLEEHFSDFKSMYRRLDEIATVALFDGLPFVIRPEAAGYLLQFLSQEYAWPAYITHAMAEGACAGVDRSSTLIHKVKCLLYPNVPMESLDPYFVGQELFALAPDRALTELVGFWERWGDLRGVTVAEINIRNIQAMMMTLHDRYPDLLNKFEFARINFFMPGFVPDEWKNRFSALLSFTLLESTIASPEEVARGWGVVRQLLKRPGLFLGELNLDVLNNSSGDHVEVVLPRTGWDRLIFLKQAA